MAPFFRITVVSPDPSTAVGGVGEPGGLGVSCSSDSGPISDEVRLAGSMSAFQASNRLSFSQLDMEVMGLMSNDSGDLPSKQRNSMYIDRTQ